MKQTPRRGKPGGTMRTGTACVIAILAFCAGLLAGSIFTASRPGGEPTAVSPAGDPDRDGHIAQALAEAARNPQDPGIWVHLGNLYFDSRNPAQAVPAYEKALELQPGNPDVMTDLGSMYRDLNNFPKALELFDGAMALHPDHQQSHYNKGVVLLFDLGRPAEAVAVWREFLARHPDARGNDGELLSSLIPRIAVEGGLHLEEKGDARGALAAYEQALLLEPRFLAALIRKAALLEKTGRAAEAVPLWTRALEMDPGALAPDGTRVSDRLGP